MLYLPWIPNPKRSYDTFNKMLFARYIQSSQHVKNAVAGMAQHQPRCLDENAKLKVPKILEENNIHKEDHLDQFTNYYNFKQECKEWSCMSCGASAWDNTNDTESNFKVSSSSNMKSYGG